MSDDLLATARRLARANANRPRQADLKRAASTAYYALFHALAKDGADLFVGVATAVRAKRAWVQVYRTLEHGFARNACSEVRRLGFPDGLVDCAESFIQLQAVRHDADYDPTCRMSRAQVLLYVDQAQQAIGLLKAASRLDRKAFAVQLRFKAR